MRLEERPVACLFCFAAAFSEKAHFAQLFPSQEAMVFIYFTSSYIPEAPQVTWLRFLKDDAVCPSQLILKDSDKSELHILKMLTHIFIQSEGRKRL